MDAQIDEFIAMRAKAGLTQRNHRRGWSFWQRHCQDLNVDPLRAPFSAFEDLLLLRRQDGLVYTRGTFEAVLAAVAARYEDERRIPAHKLPANVGSWRLLMKGAGRVGAERKREVPESAQQWEVKPLMRTDLVEMLGCEPAASRQVEACVASVLLAIDGQLTSRELARLDIAHVTIHDDGDVTVDHVVYPCDHRERVRGVPWDCTACAVKRVVAQHSGGGPLLGGSSSGNLSTAMMQRIAGLRDRRWAGVTLDRSTSGWRSTRVTLAAGNTDCQVAGFRRACVLAVGRRGTAVRWLRARAWVMLAWTGGYRMCGDLLRLRRSAVTVDPNGEGYRLALASSKDDPFGRKQVTRGIPWRDGGGMCAASMLAEYLCVRDAVHGSGGFLLVADVATPGPVLGRGLSGGGLGSDGGAGTAKRDIDLLCQLARVDRGQYSSYSTRKGFSQQAHDDGWEPEDIRDALRQQTLGVTLNSYLSARDAEKVSSDLMARVSGGRRESR